MIISQDTSIIPACDIPPEKLEELIVATADLPGIGGYKIGFVLALSIGLTETVLIIRRHTNKPIIYDHQKAGTDVPDTGKMFAKTCAKAKVTAVIFFPQSGPETEAAWIKSAQDEGLGVIVGGLMTHPKYTRSEGGYIADEAVVEIYQNAAKSGVTDFVVPATKTEAAKKIRNMLIHQGVEPIFYSPGMGAQGGEVKTAVSAAGGKLHAIIGRGICGADNIRRAAEEYCNLLK